MSFQNKSMPVEKKSNGIKGGARPGAGRKKGAPNKKTAELQKAVAESGITPLEYMLNIMRSEPSPDLPEELILEAINLRFEAAKAAAPYVHAKLSSVDVNANVSLHEQSLDQLE